MEADSTLETPEPAADNLSDTTGDSSVTNNSGDGLEATIMYELQTFDALELTNSRPVLWYFETCPELSRALDALAAYKRSSSLVLVCAAFSAIIALVSIGSRHFRIRKHLTAHFH